MKKLFLISCLTLALSACDKKEDVKKASKGSTEERITALENKVDVLEFNKLLDSFGKIAYLTPGSAGYSTVKFDLGTLTVAMKDVQPFANSTKVTLEFGNTLGATITGLKAKIEWGTVDEKGNVEKELGSKEITFDKDIQSASWNYITVVLDNVDPKNLGFLRVKEVAHTGIKLRR